ncbi:MAG: conjugal transfer protein [Actinobacteria bacterium]|nr:conjugal transfer protein [Actinomycetota bacterium]
MNELPTYTSLFQLERRLYALYDLELPVPIGFLQAGVFAGAAGASLLGMRLLGVGLTAETAWIVLVPPGFAAWWASRPAVDGRRPHRWLAAQLRHLCEPRRLDAAYRGREPRTCEVVGVVSFRRQNT